MMPVLRKAKIQDAKSIHKLLMGATGDEFVIPRPFSHIYNHLRDFYVAAEGEEVLGCCALTICWEDLAEIRSLMVSPGARGTGLGRLLVEACLSEAITLGIYRVFVLTNKVSFFSHLGFAEASKEALPQKVWADCINCPKFPDCDEIAMLMQL